MRQTRVNLLHVSTLLVIGMSSFAAENPDAVQDTGSPEMSQCSDPRPQVCTMQVEPVCASVGEETKTYSNACVACSDPDVHEFYLGVCPEDQG